MCSLYVPQARNQIGAERGRLVVLKATINSLHCFVTDELARSEIEFRVFFRDGPAITRDGLAAMRLQPTALKHAVVTSLCSACLLTGSPDKALALPPSLNDAIVELSEASYPSTHLGLKRL